MNYSNEPPVWDIVSDIHEFKKIMHLKKYNKTQIVTTCNDNLIRFWTPQSKESRVVQVFFFWMRFELWFCIDLILQWERAGTHERVLASARASASARARARAREISAEYRLFYRALLQKRPIIWRNLLIESERESESERERESERDRDGVASISRLLQIIGLFCKRAL